MREADLDDPTVPPPGRRSGAGSAGVLPYLMRTIAAKPAASVGEAVVKDPQSADESTNHSDNPR